MCFKYVAYAYIYMCAQMRFLCIHIDVCGTHVLPQLKSVAYVYICICKCVAYVYTYIYIYVCDTCVLLHLKCTACVYMYVRQLWCRCIYIYTCAQMRCLCMYIYAARAPYHTSNALPI